MWSPYLQRPDKYYLQEDLGPAAATASTRYGYGIPPNNWLSGNGWSVSTVLSAVASTGGVGAIGHMHNVLSADGVPRAAVNATNFTIPSSWSSYYRPDLAISVGQPTEKWMGVFLYKDSLTSWEKDVRIVERTGTAFWSYGAIDTNVKLPHVAVAFDPVSSRFVVVVERSEGVRFYTRPVSGFSWTHTQTNLSTFDGIDLDCSEFEALAGYNCVMAYLDRSDNGLIRSRHLKINPNGTVQVSATVVAVGSPIAIRGLTKPTIAANPDANDPQFLLSYSQHSQTITTMQLDQGDLLWSSGTSTTAQAFDWLPPAGVSLWSFFNLEVTNLSVGY
jgi:hypothetical protein